MRPHYVQIYVSEVVRDSIADMTLIVGDAILAVQGTKMTEDDKVARSFLLTSKMILKLNC